MNANQAFHLAGVATKVGIHLFSCVNKIWALYSPRTEHSRSSVALRGFFFSCTSGGLTVHKTTKQTVQNSSYSFIIEIIQQFSQKLQWDTTYQMKFFTHWLVEVRWQRSHTVIFTVPERAGATLLAAAESKPADNSSTLYYPKGGNLVCSCIKMHLYTFDTVMVSHPETLKTAQVQ